MQFSRGASYVLSGFGLLFKPKIRRFVFIPLFINIVLFSIALLLLVRYAELWVSQSIGTKADWWWLFRWAYDFIRPIISFLIYAGLLFATYFSFTLVANIISAPFNNALARATECYLLGKKVDFPEMPLIKEIILSIWQELVKVIYFVLYALPILLLLIIPGLNILFPFVWFIFMAYTLSIQYVDYPMSNHGILYKQQKQRLKKYKGVRFGFGSLANILLMVPILNFFAMPVCVIGATIWWVKELSIDNSQYSN